MGSKEREQEPGTGLARTRDGPLCPHSTQQKKWEEEEEGPFGLVSLLMQGTRLVGFFK